MKYQLQENYRGNGWEDSDEYPRDETNLQAWIDICNDMDDMEGHYNFRIIDENNAVVWDRLPPYEYCPDASEIDFDWLHQLFLCYSISRESFKKACEHWIENHSEGE